MNQPRSRLATLASTALAGLLRLPSVAVSDERAQCDSIGQAVL